MNNVAHLLFDFCNKKQVKEVLLMKPVDELYRNLAQHTELQIHIAVCNIAAACQGQSYDRIYKIVYLQVNQEQEKMKSFEAGGKQVLFLGKPAA